MKLKAKIWNTIKDIVELVIEKIYHKHKDSEFLYLPLREDIMIKLSVAVK